MGQTPSTSDGDESLNSPLTSHVVRDHVLIGAVPAFVVAAFTDPVWSFIFWLSNVLVDLDHYLNFLILTRFRVVGVRAMFQFHEAVFQRRSHPDLYPLEIFHTVEVVGLLGMAAFWFRGFLVPIFWGIVFHLLVDVVHLARYQILTKRPHSLLEYFWRIRRMQAYGRNPDRVIQEALAASGI